MGGETFCRENVGICSQVTRGERAARSRLPEERRLAPARPGICTVKSISIIRVSTPRKQINKAFIDIHVNRAAALMWQSVENRGNKKTDGTSKHGSPSSKANQGNSFVAVATEILGFVYDCGLTVGLTGVVYVSDEASDVPPVDKSFHPAGLPSSTESLQPSSSASSPGEPAAVQPVIGISQRVHTGPKKKKDLGTLGTAFLRASSIIPTGTSRLSCPSCVFL